MVPFRVFDSDSKQMWIVLNFHPNDKGGKYLLAKESDDESDGEMALVESDKMVSFKLIDFLDEADGYDM